MTGKFVMVYTILVKESLCIKRLNALFLIISNYLAILQVVETGGSFTERVIVQVSLPSRSEYSLFVESHPGRHPLAIDCLLIRVGCHPFCLFVFGYVPYQSLYYR